MSVGYGVAEYGQVKVAEYGVLIPGFVSFFLSVPGCCASILLVWWVLFFFLLHFIFISHHFFLSALQGFSFLLLIMAGLLVQG